MCSLRLILLFPLALFISQGIEGKHPSRPLITIQTSDGDIIDCIDINKQPAFENPLLKDHKIQMQPSFIPKSSSNHTNGEATPIQFELERRGGCPTGTVPIRRPDKEEKVEGRSIGNLDFHPNIPYDPRFHRAGCATKEDRGEYYFGALGIINVWNFHVSNNQYSNMCVKLMSWDGTDDDRTNTNVIQAGWTVDPSEYGDSKTRFSTYWTADGRRKTGCYDLKCPGFVQIDRSFYLGATMWPTSTYNGRQYVISINIYKDPVTRNWLLTYGPNNRYIGYWPKELFTNLAEKAYQAVWSGTTYNQSPKEKFPAMGSGHFAFEGYGKAAFIKEMEIVPTYTGGDSVPISQDTARLFYDAPTCYTVEWGNNDGNRIYVGGPSGQC